ncbi:MAG: type I pullulanase, partial [Clostridiales bacterium]|nr:type I pullulanase [Clostridiales bacterium]
MKYKKIISTIITATMLATTFVSLADPFQKIALAASTSTTYSGDDLGCTYTKEKTTFKVWAPTASKVTLKRYATGSDNASKEAVEPKSLGNVQMTKDDKTGVWTAVVEGDIKNTYYTYDVDGRETQDIYSKSTGVNGDRSMVIDLDSTNPEGWENDKRVDSPNQTDAVVWEVHVKDFSYDKNSGISDKNRGKYLAFTEQGTKYSGTDIKTGIDHLKELGVTHVQILPMYDYASVDEAGSDDQFNWGYDPKNFNTPEGSYSSNPYDGNARVTELKEMVQALHNAGIGVIMDVVYNHSYAPFGQGGNQNDFQKSQKSAFDMTVPGYYYTSTDWSGCGNSFDTTKPMYRKFVVDSMKYWAEEYHLDGFRFDLMGIIDNQTLTEVRNELNKIDPQIKIWGEPWCGDGSKNSMAGYGNKANIKNLDSNIAVFSENARDAIKGNTWDGKLSNNGWVEGNASRQTEVIAGIKAMCGDYNNVNKNIWSKQPSQVVTYTSCHDNHALYDMLCMATNKSQNGQRDDKIVNMNKLAASLVLTSQGVSFMQAGEEFGRSKLGDHNSYQSSPNINKLDWSRLETFSDLNSYYTGLIKIRNNFSAFRDPTYNAANRIQWLSTPSTSQIGYSLSNNTKGEWSKVVCLFNSNT